MSKWTEYSFVLKPSSIEGVGVFATHDLSVGIQVLSNFDPQKSKIKDIPEHLLDYCIFLNDEECLRPERFDRMEIGWYLNHSDKSNVIRKNEKLYTTRAIKAGEEILLNYNDFNEPNKFKESFSLNEKS